MMGLAQLLIFYLLIGIGVALAVLLRDDRLSAGERFFRTATAAPFWPVYLPFLLQGTGGDVDKTGREFQPTPPATPDVMDSAIAQVEAELDTALQSLGGWSEGVMVCEDARFSELRTTWRLQADRIRELDSLLAQPEFVAQARDAERVAERVAGTTESDSPGGGTETLRQTEESRRENIERLKTIRRRMYDDLMGTLAWVRELVTMIHLAKFTGAPASRADELVSQIAAVVEGLSEVSTWQDQSESVA